MRYLLIILLCFATTATAQISPEEQRARDIGAQLRCVVCQNQSIEESDAQLAGDMRRIVREHLASGATDEEVISQIRDSYGDYVLLKPPVQSNTYLLWFFPFALVLASLMWFLLRSKRQISIPQEFVLSDDDKNLLDKIMENTP